MATPVGAPDPLVVVDAWVAARNGGDAAGAMSLVASAASLFGVAIRTDADRVDFQSILEAQREAAFHVEDEGCVADGPWVRCRYRQGDAFMDKCGVALTGEHRYLVYDGKLALAERTHDAASRAVVYAAIDSFRTWVTKADPELEAIIWADANAAFYTTVDGARAMLDALDRYDC